MPDMDSSGLQEISGTNLEGVLGCEAVEGACTDKEGRLYFVTDTGDEGPTILWIAH
jgi:hypothetical protein